MGGRRRNTTKTKAKANNIHPLFELYGHPFTRYDGFPKFTWTCKMWNTPPKHCSRNQHYHPWLIRQPDQNSHTTDTIDNSWSEYRWSVYEKQRRKCYPEPVQMNDLNVKWNHGECNIIDPNSFREPCTIQFTNGIPFNGKFFLLSLQGTLASIDVTDSNPRFTILNVRRAIPSSPSRGFREYLLEFSGDLLVVFLIYKQSVDIVDDIEVYRLDLPGLRWIKMTNLGDHSLLVSSYGCIDICACKRGIRRYFRLTGNEADDWWNEQGCRKNCIYFIHGKTEDWWEFDMNDGSITPDRSVPAPPNSAYKKGQAMIPWRGSMKIMKTR